MTVNGCRTLSMDIVHQLCFWLVLRNTLVKVKVVGLKRDFIF